MSASCGFSTGLTDLHSAIGSACPRDVDQFPNFCAKLPWFCLSSPPLGCTRCKQARRARRVLLSLLRTSARELSHSVAHGNSILETIPHGQVPRSTVLTGSCSAQTSHGASRAMPTSQVLPGTGVPLHSSEPPAYPRSFRFWCPRSM